MVVQNMTKTSNEHVADQLSEIIEQIEYFIEHPRIQQKRWVARGKEWLPTLRHARDIISLLDSGKQEKS